MHKITLLAAVTSAGASISICFKYFNAVPTVANAASVLVSIAVLRAVLVATAASARLITPSQPFKPARVAEVLPNNANATTERAAEVIL